MQQRPPTVMGPPPWISPTVMESPPWIPPTDIEPPPWIPPTDIEPPPWLHKEAAPYRQNPEEGRWASEGGWSVSESF